MLTIRKEQMEVFAASALARYEARMAAYLESAFPERFPRSPAGSETERPAPKLVREGVRQAARYRITAERDVSQFIRLMVLIGPEFDTAEQMSWAKRFLESEQLDGHAKMSILMQELTDGEHTGILPEGWDRG